MHCGRRLRQVLGPGFQQRAPLLDRLVFLEVSEVVQQRRRTSRHARRTAGREPHVRTPAAPEPLEPLPPGVDLTLDGSNPLGLG